MPTHALLKDALSGPIEQACQAQIEAEKLPPSFMDVVRKIYLPLASHLLLQQDEAPVRLVSINGAQGTGKSTLTGFLRIILQAALGKPVAAFSLDDYYLTLSAREQLAKDVHPLLATRGVPGTHDLELLASVIDDLLTGRPCRVPKFNKAIDDRQDSADWTAYDEPVAMVLFEGWCNHSPVQSAAELADPINELEAVEDPDGTWRRYANDALQRYHQQVFSLADACVMLKSPDFEHVYQWRSLQEDKLRQVTPASEAHRLMDKSALVRFIQHYERITRHTLAELPEQADYLLPVRPDHSIAGVIERHEQL